MGGCYACALNCEEETPTTSLKSKVARGIVIASEAGQASHEMGAQRGGVRTKDWFCVELSKERTRRVVDHYADEFIDGRRCVCFGIVCVPLQIATHPI